MENIPMRNSALKAIAQKRVAQENGVKSIDPINKTKTVDPDTGSVTYRHSWSSSSESSKPRTTSTTPRRQSPGISPVGSKITSNKPVVKKTETSGSREFTSAPRLTPAGRTDDTKPTAAIPTVRNTPTKQERYVAVNTPSYKKYAKPGQTFEDWDKSEKERTHKNAIANQKKYKDGDEGSLDTGKNKGATCRTCSRKG